MKARDNCIWQGGPGSAMVPCIFFDKPAKMERWNSTQHILYQWAINIWAIITLTGTTSKHLVSHLASHNNCLLWNQLFPKTRAIIGRVIFRKFRARQFQKIELQLWLAQIGKGMWFECEQPFLSGERCVTSRKTAAKETRRSRVCHWCSYQIWRPLWSVTEQTHGNMESICFI